MRVFSRCLILTFFSCLCFLWAGPAWALEAGRVVSFTPGVFAERAGKTVPLEAQSIVEPGDTLRTDASGRARILFSDDSSITLGSNTTLNLQAFLPEGSKPEFKAHLGTGIVRAITGKIVEQNPAGFSLTTPEATVGIRGTIITMSSAKGVTTVYVENTLRKVYVNNIDVPGGFKITVPGERPGPEPILPQDRRDIGQAMAQKGGPGVAAAAPEPSRAGMDPGENPATSILVADNGLPVASTALATLPLANILAGDALSPGAGPGPGPGPVPTSATLSGNFSQIASTWGVANFSATFNITANLATGNVTSASMSGDGFSSAGEHFTFSAGGGVGNIGAGGFSVNGFTGNLVCPGSGVSLGPVNFANAPIDPTTNMSGGPSNISAVGNPVSGNYGIYTDNAFTQVVSGGTFSGQRDH